MANGEPAPLDQWAVPRALRGEVGHERRIHLATQRHGRNLGRKLQLQSYSRQDGGIVGSVVVRRDITESKRAQEALRQSELRFRALTEKSGELITVLDATGIITYNLAGANSTLGYAPEELVGHNAFELVHPDDLPRVAKLFQEWHSPDGKVEQAEFRLRAKDGSWRWQLAVGTNLLHEPAVGGILINSRDITERKRDEDRLRRSEERYRTLFSTLIEGFCIIEVIFDSDDRPSDYRFLEINPAFEAQTGLQNAQGRLMRELAPDHEAHWFEIYGNVALTGQSLRFVKEAKALGRWFDVSAYRVGGPESRYVAILFNDVTKSKQAEDAIRAAKEKLEERVQERTAELKERAEQLARLSTQLTMTEQRERNRLAQILHDGLQQYLMAAKLQAGELIERATDVALKQSAYEVEKLLIESIRVSRSPWQPNSARRILHRVRFDGGVGMAFPLDVRQAWLEDRNNDADGCSRFGRRCEIALVRIGARVALECGETRRSTLGEGESIPGRRAILADSRQR